MALEQLMGMILVTIAVQMFMSSVIQFLEFWVKNIHRT